MKKNNLLVRYEDLVLHPKEEFTKISSFLTQILKIKFSEEQIDQAIHLSSFSNLQGMEKNMVLLKVQPVRMAKRISFFI